MSRNTDVIVIGAGVVGCSTAYYLAKAGVTVTVLDAEMIGHGGSSRNGGGVRQSARDVRELQVVMYAVQHIWPGLSEELECDIEYHKDGNLRLARNEAGIAKLKTLVANSVAAGLDVRMVYGDEVRQINPYVSDEVIAASWCPTDGHANPMMTTLAFYRKARMMGVRFITGEKVIRIRKIRGSARQVVTAAGNVYEADRIVLCAGFQSRPIANSVGIDIPMRTEINEALVTEIQPHMFWQMLGTADADFYGHQSKHGSFVFGGDSGLEALVKTDNPKNMATSVTAQSVCRGIMKYFPNLADAKIVRHWAGYLDMTPDRLPVIDRVSEVPGLIIGCGFSGHGFGIGPGAGLLLKELTLDEPLSVAIPDLKYDRFKAKA